MNKISLHNHFLSLKTIGCLALLGVSLVSTHLLAASVFSHRNVSWLKYQEAAIYTSLEWQTDKASPIQIKLRPTLNYSGIPMEDRKEKADYFNHGKIPLRVNDLFADLLNSSRYFWSIEDNQAIPAEFEFQLVIDEYQLPFHYSADDVWWKEMNANVDRWMITPQPATLKLTLNVFDPFNQKRLLNKSIRITLAQCDLNAHIQPLTWQNNQSAILNEYIRTTPGQSFIAASNFLILEAIHLIDPQQKRARVVGKFENEIFVKAENSQFKVGQTLSAFQRTHYNHPTQLPIGKIQIVKAFKNQAVAYPINFRSDQIIIGDWLDVENADPFKPPKINYLAKNQCSQTPVAQVSQ